MHRKAPVFDPVAGIEQQPVVVQGAGDGLAQVKMKNRRRRTIPGLCAGEDSSPPNGQKNACQTASAHPHFTAGTGGRAGLGADMQHRSHMVRSKVNSVSPSRGFWEVSWKLAKTKVMDDGRSSALPDCGQLSSHVIT